MTDEENHEEDRIEIKIAGRNPEIYVDNIVKKFQTSDQVIICCVDRYLERAIYIIRLFETFGIIPETKSGKIEFIKTEEDLFDRKKNESYNQFVNRITLTKPHELFRFTKQE